MKHILLVLTLLFCTNLCHLLAQTDKDAARQITEIKLDSAYLYEEFTGDDWQTALSNAKLMLDERIEEWIKQNSHNKDLKGCLAVARQNVLEIKSKRGPKYRAFVYVRKSDIISYSNDDQVRLIAIDESSQKPKDEADLMNDVSTSEIMTEAAVSPEPFSNNSVTAAAEKTADTSDEVSALVPDTVLKAKDKEEKVILNENETPASSDTTEACSEDAITNMSLTKIEQELVSLKKFEEIDAFIRDKYSIRLLEKFGKYKEMPVDEDCYLLAYDRQGNILGHLHKIGDTYVNLVDEKTVQLSDYKNCDAIWLQFR